MSTGCYGTTRNLEDDDDRGCAGEEKKGALRNKGEGGLKANCKPF
jgi:hypothetical protein